MMNKRTCLAAVSVLFVLAPAVWAQGVTSGLKLRQTREVLDLEGAKFGCLAYCIELEIEKTEFSCNPILIPPVEGCDLPWDINTDFPTADPFGFGELCIPEKPELGGYVLRENNAVVRRLVRHHSNCTTETAPDVVLQNLPPTGNPGRPCPDPNSWNSTDEVIRTIRFVPCP